MATTDADYTTTELLPFDSSTVYGPQPVFGPQLPGLEAGNIGGEMGKKAIRCGA